MRHTKYLLTIVTLLSISSLASADRYHGNGGHHGGKHNEKHNMYGKHRGNSYSYNHGYSRHNNGRGYNKHRQYNNHNGYRNGYRHGYRNGYRNNYRNNYQYYNRYYNNYRPYYETTYQYYPQRGLGHYFTRTGYGYGHWHDGVWCATVHPQTFYNDYYSNYPYNDGWQFGDGDYGINFYLNF